MNIRALRRELVDMMYMCESVDMANTAQIAEKAKAFIDYFKDKPPSHLLASYSHMFNSILASAGLYIPIAVECEVFDKDLMQDLLATAIQHGENPFQRDWFPDSLGDTRARFIELNWLKSKGIDTQGLLKQACERYDVSWSTVQELINADFDVDPADNPKLRFFLQEPDTNLVPIPPGYQLTVADDYKYLNISSYCGEDLVEVLTRAYVCQVENILGPEVLAGFECSHQISKDEAGKIVFKGELVDGREIKYDPANLRELTSVMVRLLDDRIYERTGTRHICQLVRIGEPAC